MMAPGCISMERKSSTHWGFHGPAPKDGEMYLEAGTHSVEIQYFQNRGGAGISFQWFNLDKGAFEVVPESVLSVSSADYLETKPYIPESKLVKSNPRR